MKEKLRMDIINHVDFIGANQFIEADIQNIIEKNDMVFVPFQWGKFNGPHIDVEASDLIKILINSGRKVSYSLSDKSFPKIRDQKSVDIDWGLIITISVEIGLFVIGEIINYIRNRKVLLKHKEVNVKLEITHSYGKNKFRKVSFEGPDDKLPLVLEKMKSFMEEE